MKILYGVQATGNGHISRARAIGKYLQRAGADVDYLFSGRPRDQLFDMQQFGEFQLKRGLTFATEAGKVNYWRSFRQASMTELLRDIRQLDCRHYDLVITDFEPVTAWAARRQKVPSLAIGHQYAFLHQIPMEQANFFTQLIFKYFAPAQTHLGLHWHHFNQPILPPIIDVADTEKTLIPGKVLVYLPFEHQQQVIAMLSPLRDYQFAVYGPGLDSCSNGHISTQPPSLAAFKADLADCQYVLSNAGFELISEALQLQKRIMVKPLSGQMEQQSNALALQRLKLATRTDSLSSAIIGNWLASSSVFEKVSYPNVAKAISQWLLNGRQQSTAQLSQQLWQEAK